MTTILFWNLNRKPLERIVADLASEHEVDVVILCESPVKTRTLLRALNQGHGDRFYQPFSLCEKVSLYTRFSRKFSQAEFETGRLSIQRIKLPARIEILLVAVHFPSKLHFSEQSQSLESVELAASVRRIEEKVGHSRTVLVGDLNMNPFESGVTAASGLHAVMSKDVALRKTRIVQ
ncbi:MAG TPA: endonuclease/exonuclease/phosphatase family protein, partial [Blastocatellia bacterium]